MDPQTLRRAVAAFVRASLPDGVRVIKANPKRGRPTDDYCTIRIVTNKRGGYPWRTKGGTGSANTRRAHYRLRFYGEAPEDNATQFVAWAESFEGLEVAERSSFRVVFPLHVNTIDEPTAIVGVPFRDTIEETALVDLSVEYTHIIATTEVQSTGSQITLNVDGHEEQLDHANN